MRQNRSVHLARRRRERACAMSITSGPPALLARLLLVSLTLQQAAAVGERSPSRHGGCSVGAQTIFSIFE